MNKYSLFEYRDYKAYLRDLLSQMPAQGYGVRSKLAQALRCQVAYVSQVFNKEIHFSLEQAEELNRFFGHSHEESDYFLLLVQSARAGTRALKDRIQAQLEQRRKTHLNLKDRAGVK